MNSNAIVTLADSKYFDADPNVRVTPHKEAI